MASVQIGGYCAPHHGQQSREVIALSATGQLGMTAPGQIQLTVITHVGRISRDGRDWRLSPYVTVLPKASSLPSMGCVPITSLAVPGAQNSRFWRRPLCSSSLGALVPRSSE
jgi:hypothetical protein